MPSNITKNIIYKSPIAKLGYDFIPQEYLPKGKDEYYLRNIQQTSNRKHRQLTAYEIEVLVRNNNTSDDWTKILVSEAFNPELVKNCKFNGLVRIGKLEPICLSFSDLTTPVGLYNSNIISCDFGDNVVVENVNYLSHYIIGDEVILININEMVTSNKAKFGNGIVKQGEDENSRVWLEVCNENAGRKILPFNGMQPGDAFLWSKYRDDFELLEKLKEITEKQFTTVRGYYGKVGSRTIIKNSASIKDVWIGEDAYIKGANKLKNLTINSGDGEGRTQIGEGCELVNGIVGYGCRIFYGVKAVRFIISSHSQLKYGARLINSYLGYNSTISCCEVLNALIFSSHEQHHNNSFLCAALVFGQSNLAAGATLGSNHNSRGADGEIIAGRGFWPGLCVSIKHNSIFASYTILAKADYSSELNISLPFSLVSNDVTNDRLVIMPAYWLMYNMYALARNAWKYIDRDKRVEKKQNIEYDFLAPDTVNEIIASLSLIEELVGKNELDKQGKLNCSKETYQQEGCKLLSDKKNSINEVIVDGGIFENSRRKVHIVKIGDAYHLYKKLVDYYAATHIISLIQTTNIVTTTQLFKEITFVNKQTEWLNIGGQLMLKDDVDILKSKIKSGKFKSWNDVHSFYQLTSNKYKKDKLHHAITCVLHQHQAKKIDKKLLIHLINEATHFKQWITKNIESSRAKDYTSEFRKMVYDNEVEMTEVIGNIKDNTFINDQKKELKSFKKTINDIKKKFNLK
ncbi:MAG: DUF4954 family protein [Chitinophagaceae bacterium]